MVFAASRESKVFAHSGALVQVIRFLLKAAMYSSLSFWMMYCVITDNLKVDHKKKNAQILTFYKSQLFPNSLFFHYEQGIIVGISLSLFR